MSSRKRSALLVIFLVSILSVVPPSTGSVGPVAPLTTGWIPMEGSQSPGHADGVIDAKSPSDTPGIDATQFSAVHEGGVTGEGVKVGVIGSRFDANHRAIDDQVSDSRQFASDGRLLSDGGAHDTGVAEIVGRTAPNSSLYLAGVGSQATPETYAAAIEWLLANDVDVIVDSASYFPPDATGMDEMNAVAANASDEVVFITSAGNYAKRHWTGTVDANTSADEWVQFGSDTAYNFLGDGALRGQISLRLYWSGDADFDLYVYRNTPGPDDPVVAKSVDDQSGDGKHAEAIDTTLPEGHYYVAIRVNGVATSTELDLFAANHDLSVTDSNESMVAPATAENVIAVGAIHESGEQRSYSSMSHLLDISAPDGTHTAAAGDLHGSSASAPVVAGTVALMVSQNGELTPEQTERILKGTATESDGQLQLNMGDAVSAAAVSPDVLPEPDDEGETTTRDEWVTRDERALPEESVVLEQPSGCWYAEKRTA